MSKLRKRALLATTALSTVLAGGTIGDGAITINMPTEDQTFFPYANIETAGDTDDGVDVWVTISLSGAIAASKKIEVPGGGTEWYHDFDAPSGGWDPPAPTWRAHVYDDADHENAEDTVKFRIIEVP